MKEKEKFQKVQSDFWLVVDEIADKKIIDEKGETSFVFTLDDDC